MVPTSLKVFWGVVGPILILGYLVLNDMSSYWKERNAFKAQCFMQLTAQYGPPMKNKDYLYHEHCGRLWQTRNYGS